MTPKHYTLPALLLKIQEWRRAGKKLVFTNGCFDLIHVGHVRYLEEAKSKGDILIVGLNSDSSVTALKGPKRPIMTQEDRTEILSALSSVDAVVIFSESSPLKLVEALKPDILVKGGDWDPKDIVGSEMVKKYGGKVLSLSFVSGQSTSGLIQRIIDRS